ncbi:MAG: excinuclease ABC subunit UvrA [bacterium]|nr:excinuclease ABC subunit UvrA [bacterium]
MHESVITVTGAREHNLKNIDIIIPKDKLVVITGLSGSGKSSLAFDTLYAEGQRRYVESLSAYARQFLGIMEKPDVDHIEGLSPAISIDQKNSSRNPRSTVGTVTEIYDYMRLLWARVGEVYCPKGHGKVEQQSASQIADKIISLAKGKVARIMIQAPLVRDRKGEHRLVISGLIKKGIARVAVDGQVLEIEEAATLDLDKQKKHTIAAVIDRLLVDGTEGDKTDLSQEERIRILDSVEKALKISDGLVEIVDTEKGKSELFSEHFACNKCDFALPELEPRVFSFNSPHGACPKCQGLGTLQQLDAKRIVPNGKLTISEGAIRPWSRSTNSETWMMRILQAVVTKHNFDLDTPFNKLKKRQQDIVLYGTAEELYSVNGYETMYEGVIPNLARRHKETDSDYIRTEIEKYMISQICPVCLGGRLKEEIKSIKIGDKSIVEANAMDINLAETFYLNLPKKLSEMQLTIANQVLKEISTRIKFLKNVGLDYLTLDRSATTLAGGEAQRIRLATQIGSGLTGVLYILDEPSIGLHQRDNDKLLETLKELRDLGNSVIVVEHDEDTMRAADYLIDIGPGAGKHGGEVVALGTPEEVTKAKGLTAEYLRGDKKIKVPTVRRQPTRRELTVVKASANNLKDINVTIPLGLFVCVTGVSGSGKSTLVYDIVAKTLAGHYHRARTIPGQHKEIKGLEQLDKVIIIDQSPIGRTPRSNPATYTGVFTYVRELFAATKEAKSRGYSSGRFSFNVKGGRCEACAGDGVKKIEMNFLPDIYVKCEVCKGKRYNEEALQIMYKGKTTAEVLDMTIDEALEFFQNITAIKRKLKVLSDVGLGYMHLGQPATTLSGGEAQRIKLASELSRRSTGRTIYILDEPTTGLHFDDINRLLQVLQRLVSKGNSVLVIEHNIDVIKSADWIIDLGPEGGAKGGYVIVEGSPETAAAHAKSYTGQYLKRVLSK